MITQLDFKEEEKTGPCKSNDLNKHNQNLSRLLREQQFFQTQGNDFMVDKLQGMIERAIQAQVDREEEAARNNFIIV